MSALARLLVVLALAVAGTSVSAQTLSVSPTSAIAGTSVSATWSGIAAPTATDWIGLYVPGAAHTAHLAWRYTSGAASGSVPFTIPLGLASGNHELRLFSNNVTTLLATSNGLALTGASLALGQSVVPPSQALDAVWSNIGAPTATDWIGLYVNDQPHSGHITWRYTTGTASGSVPFTIPPATPPGGYELRLFSNNATILLAKSPQLVVPFPVITASPASLVAGEALLASWSNIGVPATSDWIGLYAPGATTYLAWRYTTGSASGAVPFTVPASVPAGTYELRLRAAAGLTLATSATFAVTPAPPPVLQSSPAVVNPGGALSVTWSNIAAPAGTDWIGLYAPGTPNSAYLDWRYTGGTAAGSLSFPIGAGQASGTYELRLLAAGQVLLASGPAFTVQPPPKTLSGTLTKAGAPMAGVTILGTGASCSPSNASGQYTCTVPHGWTGTLTPSSNGNVFTPAERSFANVVADQGAQDFTAQSGGARMSYIHPDHLNTPRLVADSAGTSVWRWDQVEPFGVNVPDENPSGLGAFEFPLRFPGQYADKETNLHYNYFRDYDAGIGRFVQSDPIGLAGDINTYAYIDSDPLSSTDSFGLTKRGGPTQTSPSQAILNATATSLISQIRQYQPSFSPQFVSAPGQGGYTRQNISQYQQLLLQLRQQNVPTPTFVVTPNACLAVPVGSALVPVINRAGAITGQAFAGGTGGGFGLAPSVTQLRLMNPTPQNLTGYANYMNMYQQSVNPFTGRPLLNRFDPLWHIQY